MHMHKITATTFSVICCFTRAFLTPPLSTLLSLSLRVALLIHLCVVDLFFTNSQSVQRLLPFLVFLNLMYRHTFKADNVFGVWGWGGCYLCPVLMFVLIEVNAWDVLWVVQYGRQFVDVFLLRGMPVLDATFTSHSVDVHSLLRSLQQSTRTLQNMCSHAKVGCDIFTCFAASFLSLLLSPKLIFVRCL